jgi:hypothetical protein
MLVVVVDSGTNERASGAAPFIECVPHMDCVDSRWAGSKHLCPSAENLTLPSSDGDAQQHVNMQTLRACVRTSGCASLVNKSVFVFVSDGASRPKSWLRHTYT